MKQETSFFRTVCRLAIPAALQSMLQSSFSIVDQIMIGQLGSVEIAGVGLAGKFASIVSVVVSAIGAVAGIMISQYIGQRNAREVRRSFFLNLSMALLSAVLFAVISFRFPTQIMGLYTRDPYTKTVAAKYLIILSGTFLPMAGATMLATLFRCMEKASLPLYASIGCAVVNTGINYVLIFGKLGFPSMGATGAAIATLISQIVNFLVMLLMFLHLRTSSQVQHTRETPRSAFHWHQYASMLLPVLLCEVLWSLGENIYAGIYGHIGTEASAAMTLLNPIQGLMIGALSGLSQAAGVIIGKQLGEGEYDVAYQASKQLIFYGLIGSAALSILIVLTSSYYVKIYRIEESVKLLTRQILFAYAIVAPFKVENMILGGGIIRSGGKTNYVLLIDFIGTWLVGVPLGLISAFLLHLSIPYVYFLLSLEECVRFGISLVVLCRKNWMQSLKA